MTPFRIFIQARMSSTRFPGKVLAKLDGQPIIRWAILNCQAALDADWGEVVVLTSTDPSDDVFVEFLGDSIPVFRGSLDDVFGRFRAALDITNETYPCERFVRICADSPFHAPKVLEQIMSIAQESDADITTNVYPTRSYPPGQSVEVVKTSAFLSIDPTTLTDYQREHVTPVFYQNPERWRIKSVTAPIPAPKWLGLTVDTPEDLLRVEQWIEANRWLDGVMPT